MMVAGEFRNSPASTYADPETRSRIQASRRYVIAAVSGSHGRS